VPLSPNEIDPELLPRASVGGFKRGPVEELLKRVAWDYRQLLHNNHELRGQLAELEARADELERQLERIEKEGRRKQPDELARQALAASQRAARELRESTRQECEVAIKKARTRAERIEQQFYQDNARAVAELRELEELRRAAVERLRSSLNAALEQVDDSKQPAALDAELVGRLDSIESRPGTA
jgi:cell division septum initiation protein DivIVA